MFLSVICNFLAVSENVSSVIAKYDTCANVIFTKLGQQVKLMTPTDSLSNIHQKHVRNFKSDPLVSVKSFFYALTIILCFSSKSPDLNHLVSHGPRQQSAPSTKKAQYPTQKTTDLSL